MPLTPAQLPTLAAAIAANTAVLPAGQPFAGVQVKDVPKNGDGAAQVAWWYNQEAAGPWVVWRDLPMADVLNLITFANMTPVDGVPAVTALGSNPSVAQNATYDNQMAGLHGWNARANLCQSKQFNLQNLTLGRDTAPMKRSVYRAGLQDCLTNIPSGAAGAPLAANWVGVRDGAKFNATNAEKLFATGTGTTAAPADLSFEGSLSDSDVRQAWGI